MAFNVTSPLVRKAAAFLSLAAMAAFYSGCATITRGTHEALVIESEPSGAQVRLSNGFTGTTPTSFKVNRKGELTVTISKEGYNTVTVNVTTQVAGAGAAGMAGNVLVGGVIGAGIDAFSGGMLEHKPNPIKVNLVASKIAAPAIAAAPAPVTPVSVTLAGAAAAAPATPAAAATPSGDVAPKPAAPAVAAPKPASTDTATEKKTTP